MRTLLKKFKYGGRPDLSRPLARMLTDLWAAEPSLGPVDAVVPVPLHWTRERLRGYNQARVLAQAFAKKAGLPVLEALKRRRPAPSQTSLDKLARAANVRDAFQARRPEAVRGKTLLLVDDVCTTGATLEACARALKAAGARRVSALTAARQVSF
jgi:ComF family protein